MKIEKRNRSFLSYTMHTKYREALPRLQEKIKFQMEDISPLDYFYSDGDSRVMKSFFKLVFTRQNNSVSVVFIYEGGWWVSHGLLTDKEALAIHDWMDDLAKA